MVVVKKKIEKYKLSEGSYDIHLTVNFEKGTYKLSNWEQDPNFIFDYTSRYDEHLAIAKLIKRAVKMAIEKLGEAGYEPRDGVLKKYPF